jgi:dipeptidyl aminopeptidase/acylaminoacyl peptidase
MLTSIGANAIRLVEVSLESGATRVVAEDPSYDVAGVLTHRATHDVLAVQFMRARAEWLPIDRGVAGDFEALASVRGGDVHVLSSDDEERTWLVAYVADRAPAHYYAFDRAARGATFLFTNRPRLAEFALGEMRPIAFAARDGLTIHGYLTLPPDRDVGRPPPLVLLVHGGPWIRDMWGLHNEAQWLANRGYAVLQVNFRGSTGYGKAFVNAGDREWGAAMLNDLIDAKAWAIAAGHADPERVAIYGGSYGGYAVLAAVAFRPREFACGVDIVGPSNLVTLISSIPPYWTPMRALFDRRVGRLDGEEAFLKSRSPLFAADRIERPLLIAQGANDPRVKQAESDQIVTAMRRRGKEVEYLVFPDEGHGFARPENRMKFYAAAEQFLAAHLGGRAEPPEPEERWEDLRA